MAEDCSAMARSGPPYLPGATALRERMGALVNDIKALESSGGTILPLWEPQTYVVNRNSGNR
jgi:hypothetical protein